MQERLEASDEETNLYSSYLKDGGEMGELTRHYDWSATIIGAPGQWPQSLLTTLGIILHSKFPMFLFWGPEHICFYNDAYRPSLGNNGKHPYALGKKGEEIWPEIWPDIKPLIAQVLSGKGATWSEDQLLPIYRNDKMEDVYWTFSYSPVIGEGGRSVGVFVTCTETTKKVQTLNMLKVSVTETVMAKRQLEESEKNLRNIIMQSPVAMCIFRGPAHIVEIANERMLELWGKPGSEILNKPIFDGLPEAKGQGFEELLHNVYTTGEKYKAYGLPAMLPRDGKVETVYINFVYDAFKEADGTISGIMAVASEVTEQVIARRTIQEAEEKSRLAIRSAELGVYETVFGSNKMTVDTRFNEIWGFDQSASREEYAAVIHPEDLPVRELAHKASITTGQLHYEARIIWKDKSVHWVGVRGKVIYDDNGKAIKLLGVVQDITEQKKFSEELEKKVNERTKELAEANMQLQQSNIELNQFAYVASHDLQEPLRKVRTFTGLMELTLGDISKETKLYIKKIQDSTERMQALINDVLKFSLLSKEREKFQNVDLNNVLKAVLSDYELLIEQKSAKIIADELPVIEAIPLQMVQLFTNIISNALKFASKERQLEISVLSKQLSKEEVQQHKELSEDKVHYVIEFKDNGIGFDQEYAQRIFTMFQRLHGKMEYEGTGIGLAMCRKITINHHGSIYAISNANEGASFIIILPEKQS